MGIDRKLAERKEKESKDTPWKENVERDCQRKERANEGKEQKGR